MEEEGDEECGAEPCMPPPRTSSTPQTLKPTADKDIPSKKGQPQPSTRSKKALWGKRPRHSGKKMDRPYASSNVGDMCRLMTRLIRTTEAPLNVVDTPPVELNSFWHKYKLADTTEKLHYEYVEVPKVTTPPISMNRYGFDLLAKTGPSGMPLQTKKDKVGNKGKPDLNTTTGLFNPWKNFRVSRSFESLISSSTKVSEMQELVSLEGGWSDEEDTKDEFLSDSDDDHDIASSNTSVRGGQPEMGASKIHPSVSTTHPIVKDKSKKAVGVLSSLVSIGYGAHEKHRAQQEIEKEMGLKAMSVLHKSLDEARLATDQALKGERDRCEVIDTFMSDVEESVFLTEALSYALLPDSAFVPDFDYYDEDPITRQMEKEKTKKDGDPLLAKGKHAKKRKERRLSASETTLEIMTDTESEMGSVDTLTQHKSVECAAPSTAPRDDYETCMAKHKKRIEDRIRAAVACRNAMGAYIVPQGGQPLARTGAFEGPGPAAYSPNLNAVKSGPVGVFLVKRWSKNIYETPGPGPATYAPSCKQCTGEMLNLHFAERFEKSETIGPGPGQYDTINYARTGKDKPHALILSRPSEKKVGCGGSKYVNIYGFNQFGRRNPPKALIIGRYEDKEKIGPAPGSRGDAYGPKDRRVGILMKSRIPPIGLDATPGFVNLPPLIGQGPGISLGIRKFPTLHADSPGPIYQLPANDPKPVTMTFKPFPMPGKEADPSPLNYGTKPGDQAIKMTKPKGANPLICGSHDLNYGKGNTPGPNKYKIKDCKCKIGITMTSRYDRKTDTDSAGPADYSVGRSHLFCPPRAVFQHKWRDTTIVPPPKCKWNPQQNGQTSPILDICTSLMQSPKDRNHVKGGLLYSRWPQKSGEEPGPGFYDLFGFTSRGKYSKIPISLKSRQSPFVFTHMSNNAEVPNRTGCDQKIPSSTNC